MSGTHQLTLTDKAKIDSILKEGATSQEGRMGVYYLTDNTQSIANFNPTVKFYLGAQEPSNEEDGTSCSVTVTGLGSVIALLTAFMM